MVNIEDPQFPIAIFAEGSIVEILDQQNHVIDGVAGQLCTLRLYTSIIREYDLQPRPDNVYKMFLPNAAFKSLRGGAVYGRMFLYCNLLGVMRTDDDIGQLRNMLVDKEKESYVDKATIARLQYELSEAKINIKEIVNEQKELLLEGVQVGRQMNENNNK